MAYSFEGAHAGYFAIANVDSGITPPNQSTAIPTPPARLGTIVKAADPTYGQGEFICLAGCASTVVGSLVTYDGTTYATTLCATTTLQARPVAVAMSANTATTSFGWYQIGGTAVVAKSAVAIAAKVAIGVNSTGKIGNTASGKEIRGARSANAATVASATTTIAVVINRPHLEGRIT